MLGKENRYFYTRHSNNNDRWIKPNPCLCRFFMKKKILSKYPNSLTHN